MRRAITLGITAAAVSAAGCSEARSENGGPTVERNYQVAGFDKIELAGAYDATVRTGSAPGVQARGNEKAIENLEVVVENNTLVIRHKKRTGFSWGSKGRKVALTVTVPNLRGAELAGSGDIKVDRVAGDSFDGAIAGSGNLRVDRIEVGNLKLSIAGSGNAEVGSGRAKNAEYNIAGSGGINAKGMTAETAAVSIAGSGDIEAHASSTASVNIMGSGDVELTGGAKCSVSKAGSGNARCS